MNKKLLAIAVAGAVATPVVAQAQLQFYGRIGNEIQVEEREYNMTAGVRQLDDGTLSTTNADGSAVTNTDSDRTDLDTYSSRLGLRYDQSIGNGMSVHGQYEFDVVSDRENTGDGDAINDVRIATVGVSGAFGRIDVGNQWSSYYNKIGGNVDTMDMIYSTISQGPARVSNAIKYSNVFGPIDFEADVRVLDNDSTDNGRVGGAMNQTEGPGDGFGVGASFSPMAGFSVSLGYNEESNRSHTGGRGTVTDYDTTRWGVAASYNFGPVTVRGGWQEVDNENPNVEETTSYYVSASGSFNEQTSWLVGYAEGESLTDLSAAGQGVNLSTDEDSDELVARLAHKVGGGLSVGYEGSFQTAAGHVIRNAQDVVTNDSGYELTRHVLYMQVDF